jgi:hypothetical protein
MLRFIMFSVLMLAGAVAAQDLNTPDLSGTWVIQADVDATRNRRPINGVSIATELVIRQSPQEVTMQTNTGTGGSTVTTTHKLDGSDYEIEGPIGWGTRARARWEGTTFAVDIRRSVQGPQGELVFDIQERYTRAADTLTLVRTLGRTTQTLVYKLR